MRRQYARHIGKPARRNLIIIGLSVGLCGSAVSQVLKVGHAGEAPSRTIPAAMSHTVVVQPVGPVPGNDADNSALIGLLHRQGEAARALLVSASTGSAQPGRPNNTSPLLSGSSTQMLNPQPYPPKGSSPQIAAGQTMSAQGNVGAPSSISSAVMINPATGPAKHQPPSSPKQMVGVRAPAPTQICIPGIASVDGQKSGIWFSPVAGSDGTFVIQGCGFGTTTGEVYLSGVHYDSNPSRSRTQGLHGLSIFPDHVSFQISPNNWADRQLVAQIDANASGLYDTNNVTLVVKTATGQQYQAGGFNFSAAREDQVLNALPKPSQCTGYLSGPCLPFGVKLVTTNSPAGPVTPLAESPSEAFIKPGETIAVARGTHPETLNMDVNSPPLFRGGLDTYQFQFAPGFQLDPHSGVQLRHTSVDSSYCQSVEGNYSNSGNWSVNYTSKTSFQVYWEEEGCWPKVGLTTANFLDFGSVSAYALQITVLGPRGVSPWASSAVNGLGIQKQMPSQLLKQ